MLKDPPRRLVGLVHFAGRSRATAANRKTLDYRKPPCLLCFLVAQVLALIVTGCENSTPEHAHVWSSSAFVSNHGQTDGGRADARVVVTYDAAPESPMFAPQPALRALPALDPPTNTHPPPISGGSMESVQNGRYLIAADSDRDRVLVMDPSTLRILSAVDLAVGDEPGRVAEDASGLVHVVLRRANEVAVIDPAIGALVRRQNVCATPRGIALDPIAGVMRVVCMSGEMVSYTNEGIIHRRTIVPDLRDIVVRERDILVSTFRGARVLFLDRTLQQTGELSLDSLPANFGRLNTLWRMRKGSHDTVLISAQESTREVVSVLPLGYGVRPSQSHCLGTVNTVVLRVRDAATAPEILLRNMLVPLSTDLAEAGGQVWVVSAANRGSAASQFPSVFAATNTGCELTLAPTLGGRAYTSVASVGDSAVVFDRDSGRVFTMDGRSTVAVFNASVGSPGHEMFHGNFNNHTGLTCATCHAEGGDDGLVWNFSTGSFRTPSLRGPTAHTAPFHWSGEFAVLTGLFHNVFTERMGGPRLTREHTEAFRDWVESIPSYSHESVGTDTEANHRGEVIFRSDTAGCAGCHSGSQFTNNQTMDVGTGGAFQVPSLVGVRFRAPYMHNGCAASIDARLSDMACGGAMHGGYGLSAQEKSDLAAYLGSI